MTVVLPLSGLAQTRLFSARGGAGESAADGRRVGNRLSTTCSGVRTRGARVNTVATVAILFRLAFRPLARRAEGWGTPLGLTGHALAIHGRQQNGASRGFRRALPIKSVEIPSGIAQHFLQAAFGNRNAGEVGDGRDRCMEGVLHSRLDRSPL